MLRLILLMVVMTIMSYEINAQIPASKFGSGFQFIGKDSSFYLKAGFRFQTLYVGEWRKNEGQSSFDNVNNSFLIRRSRLKFSGWAASPKLLSVQNSGMLLILCWMRP